MSENEKSGGMGQGTILAIAGAAVVAIGVLVFAFGGFGGGDGADGGEQALAAEDFGLGFGRPGDIVMGDPEAPVEIVEYASTTCGACAGFHVGVLPALKEKYIEEGLVRYTVRELPTSPQALAIAGFMVARCIGEDRYYDALDVLFRTQAYWVGVESMAQGRERLAEIARQAGLSQSEFDQCLASQPALDRIRNVSEEGANEFGVTGTPSFFVNGERLEGGWLFENLDEQIIAALPEDRRPEPGLPEGWDTSAGPAAEGDSAADEAPAQGEQSGN